jgi:hypothetical protein
MALRPDQDAVGWQGTMRRVGLQNSGPASRSDKVCVMRTSRLAMGMLCVGLLGAGVAQAQVWKCKSLKTGQIEYSDIQCDGKSTVASTINARPTGFIRQP